MSEALLRLLAKKGVHAQLLSSDALRKVLTPKPTYSLEERDAVYATLVYIALLLTENGANVVIDATGNLKRYRTRQESNFRDSLRSILNALWECA
jgi:adenylylsulfate kinase